MLLYRKSHHTTSVLLALSQALIQLSLYNLISRKEDKLKHHLLIISILFFFFNSVLADTIHLKDGKTINGQLLKVSEKMVIIETIKKGKIINISINRENINRITDDSKKILYENSKLNVSNLGSYYNRNDLFLNQNKVDTLILTDGSSVLGEIIDISDTKLQLRIKYPQSEKSFLRIIPFTQISEINELPLSNVQRDKLTMKIERANVYPKLAFELGGSFAFTNLGKLKNMIDQYLIAQSQESGIHIDGIVGKYGLVQLSFIIKFSTKIGLGVTGHFDFTPEENAFRIMFSEFKYYFPWRSLSPWVGLGYASQSIRIADTIYGHDATYSWACKSNGPSFAIGIETANETDTGFYTNIRYLLFPTKRTLNKELDLSVILISVGIITNF